MKKPILLTAFEPFGGEAVNPSLEILRALEGRSDVVACRVPVVFHSAAETVFTHPRFGECGAVLMLGQAKGRAGLTVERIALNVDDASMPDNAGEQPVDRPILPGGPAAYFATIPIKAAVSAIRASGVPASVSNSAGTYVCNHLMYSVLARLDAGGVPAGFIHVPCLPQQASPGLPSMTLPDMVRGVSAVLDILQSRPPAKPVV